jgi:hypothetical protein
MEYDNTNKGVLFSNDQGGNKKRPSLRGSLNVAGKDYNVSGWYRESKKDGKPFLSISVEPKGESKFAPPKAVPVAQDLDNLDDFKF